MAKQKIKFAEVTGKVTKIKRDQAVRDFNSGKLQVLLITKAGGEGLDLKGTRDIIIMESSWNRAVEVQVIGRGVRFRSHSDLPEDQRKVDVFYLIMKKPVVKDIDDIKPSADEMLKTLTEQKQVSIESFVEKLYPLSIERSC
jgi:SNF2 family DNA or RNA helicase